MKIQISIIVPCYNSEKYIVKCINSIYNQTLKNIEIIIINDGSTDETLKRIEEQNYDSRVKVYSKKNEGQGIARNFGIDKAEGEFIAFVDSDDYIEENMLEEMYNKINEEKTDICVCPINKKSNISKITKDDLINDILGQKLDNSNEVFFGCAVWSKLYRRNIIETNKIRFESERKIFSEDLAFNMMYLKYIKNVSIVDYNYYYVTIETTSYTHRYNSDYLNRSKYLFEYLTKNFPFDGKNKEFYNNFLSSILLEIEIVCKQEILYSNDNFKQKLNNLNEIIQDEFVCKILNEIKEYDVSLKRKLLIFSLKNSLSLYIFLKSKKILKKIF